jgi:hypothetical protein
MNDTVIFTPPTASVEEIQRGWHEVKSRVAQLEAERAALEQENKSLRFLLERVIEHRQKSHTELVLLLSGLVSKLPINDIGVVISKLVEHNAHVNETCAALAKGKADTALPQPLALKALDQTKRDLVAALKPAVEDLIKLDPPLESEMLRSLIEKPENFFSPAVVRANRCFVKAQLPRERIVKEFGADALVFFNDMTTDSKRNPRPKPEEIVLSFKSDFPAVLQQNPALLPDKRPQLQALYEKVQRSKGDAARAQKDAFFKLSFLLELLHYYENQSTEAPDVIFAQRLPVLVEQLVVPGAQDPLDEKLIAQAEALLAHIISSDHRLMVANNLGKAGGSGRTLRYVLRLRIEKLTDDNPTILNEVVPEFVKHLIPAPPEKPPTPQALAAIVRLLGNDWQKPVIRGVMSSDRMSRQDAETLGRAIAKDLNLTGLEEQPKPSAALPPEMERQLAWDKIKELITERREPAAIAGAIRDRLHTKFDADELKQSWITLTEADPMSFIRAFCQIPYLADGRTDNIARPVLESYVVRLTHEKYAATYTKVVNSLKNILKAKPDSPMLLNFMSLVKWVDSEAARRMSHDIGMVAAH